MHQPSGPFFVRRGNSIAPHRRGSDGYVIGASDAIIELCFRRSSVYDGPALGVIEPL